MNALKQAEELQTYAASKQFDWKNPEDVWNKIYEEIEEVKTEINHYQKNPTQTNKRLLEAEIGDLIFSCINLARKFNINSETALLRTNQKFSQRFKWMETNFNTKNQKQISIKELEKLWEKSKTIK